VADGTAAHKKTTATGQMRKVNVGWFLVRYEDHGVEEWLRLPGDAFKQQLNTSKQRRRPPPRQHHACAEGYTSSGMQLKRQTRTRRRPPRRGGQSAAS